MTLGSLFDGSGGFPLGGLLCGIEPLWASEVEPFPIRVTTKRFPNVKHLGNIMGIKGGAIEPVNIITFGSPCQSFSVAGKREGMEAKSWETVSASAGARLTLNFGESRNDAAAVTLSSILMANVPAKYYLTSRACEGILRRASARGKALPEILRLALEAQCKS